MRREVALKLIRERIDSKLVLARFDAERQALAMMDLPNIARVFDGGTTNGQPFFVMELINGIPITAYYDRERLPSTKLAADPLANTTNSAWLRCRQLLFRLGNRIRWQ